MLKQALRTLALLIPALTAPLLGQYSRPFFRPVPPAVPATTLYPDYPIHLRILDSRWNFDYGNYAGFGRADILGLNGRGLDFNYTCDQPFRHNELHGEFYQARWKKQDQQLEILLQKVGSDHLTTCKLKTTLKPTAYAASSATWTDPVAAASAQPTPPAPPTTPPPR